MTADHVGMQVPALEHLLQRSHIARLRHDEHPLLRLTEHHLVRGHSRLATRGAGHVDLDAATAAMGQFSGAAAEPGRAEVLHGDDARIAGKLEAGLHEALLEKWIADLDRGAARRAARIEHHRREARAVDPVATGVGANEQHEVAGSARLRADHPALLDDADAHRVDEAVRPVRLVEIQLAADSRNADAVAVTTDARDDAVEKMALMRLVERAEAKRIEQRDRSRAHREDVAQDAADARRRALVRLDRARMVVRLDLEDARKPVADVDSARVLARTLQHARPRGGQRPEQRLARLVAAVLAPQRADDAELEAIRLAPERLARCSYSVRVSATSASSASLGAAS